MVKIPVGFTGMAIRYGAEYLGPFAREQRVNKQRLNTLLQHFGNRHLLHMREVDEFFRSMPSQQPSTRNRYRSLLRHMLKWGAERQYVQGTLPIKLEREHNHRTRRLSIDEEIRLLEVMDDDLRYLFIAALDTGLRFGALTQLTWKNYNETFLLVPGALQKHREPQRIPLTKRLRIHLENAEERTAKLFPIESFQAKWNRARKRAGLVDFRWHDLRGEFASRLDEAGVETSVISQLLGHASLLTTQRYLRPRTERFEEAIAKLGV